MKPPTSFLSNIIALFGKPVADNPTQYMHEKAFEALGLNWRYVTLEVTPENLGGAILGMRAMGFSGANCTIPHKVAVIPFLDEITPAARKIGAVNTIYRTGDTIHGENTDGKGFIRALEEVGFSIPGVAPVILGAGGAARAIAVELVEMGAKSITIINRSPQRAEITAQHIVEKTGIRVNVVQWIEEYAVPKETRLLINATSIGLAPNNDDLVPIDYGTVHGDMLVCDVIPNPPFTQFLKNAGAMGATTLDGLGMLVHQGAYAFKLWTQEEAPILLMREALEEVFSN